MSILRRSATALLVMAAVLVLASGCRFVGSGTMGYVPAGQYGSFLQPAANSGSPVSVQVFRPDARDTWPPPGQLGLWLHADNMPALVLWPETMPAIHDLYLVRLYGPSEQANREGLQFRSCEELNSPLPSGEFRNGAVSSDRSHTLGKIYVNPDQPVDALVTIDDTPENREASWVLAVRPPQRFWQEFGGYAIRCGTITVAP